MFFRPRWTSSSTRSRLTPWQPVPPTPRLPRLHRQWWHRRSPPRCATAPTAKPSTRFSQSISAPLFFQNGAKSGFEMCFGPSTLGAGAKTRLESRIKRFTPHCHIVFAGSNPSRRRLRPVKRIVYCRSPFFKPAPSQTLDLRCASPSDPSTLGAGAPTNTRASVVWCRGSQPIHVSNAVLTPFRVLILILI